MTTAPPRRIKGSTGKKGGLVVDVSAGTTVVGVAVGTGVDVGTGVLVGSGVAVGTGDGVSVGTGVGLGGTGVAVGASGAGPQVASSKTMLSPTLTLTRTPWSAPSSGTPEV